MYVSSFISRPVGPEDITHQSPRICHIVHIMFLSDSEQVECGESAEDVVEVEDEGDVEGKGEVVVPDVAAVAEEVKGEAVDPAVAAVAEEPDSVLQQLPVDELQLNYSSAMLMNKDKSKHRVRRLRNKKMNK